MPNKVDDFTPYRLMKFIEARLNLISKAMGFNCDVLVTTDFEVADNSTAKHTLYFDVSGGATPAKGIGGDPLMNPFMTVEIGGSSIYETEDARRLAMSLEQDVRTALHTGFDELRPAVGKGVSMTFENVNYGKAVLKSKNEAWFLLTTTFTWSQRSDW